MLDLVPPPHLDFVGGNFLGVGQEFLGHFRTIGGLRPWEAVLDVGSGTGRMAVPLTQYLDRRGRYEGFDIVAEGVRWCQEQITPRFPNFRFRHVDLYNKHYNRLGACPAAAFRFPYPDASFDFVVLTSVFTHLLPRDLENYVGEIARVLRRGGRVLTTFFLLNETSLAAVRAGRSRPAFRPYCGPCWCESFKVPEAAVAYDEAAVRALWAANGLRVDEPIRYGNWCGREPFCSYQDLLLATKERDLRPRHGPGRSLARLGLRLWGRARSLVLRTLAK
jgi:SAM-dependent methyltransferase